MLLLLAALPALALAPAVAEGRLLAPGDGTALHYPLRVEAWDAWRHGELPSWNPGVFSGVPLLAGTSLTNELVVRDAVERIIASNRRRVCLLGLSFKMDTDDLR